MTNALQNRNIGIQQEHLHMHAHSRRMIAVSPGITKQQFSFETKLPYGRAVLLEEHGPHANTWTIYRSHIYRSHIYRSHIYRSHIYRSHARQLPTMSMSYSRAASHASVMLLVASHVNVFLYLGLQGCLHWSLCHQYLSYGHFLFRNISK